MIHCRRDLRDVALSCWTADFRSVPWASDPSHIGAIFRQYLRIMDHWRSALPTPIHEFDYEEIVSDFENSARRMVSAAGLDWDPACAEFHRSSRSVHTGSRVQVRRPLHTRSVAPLEALRTRAGRPVRGIAGRASPGGPSTRRDLSPRSVAILAGKSVTLLWSGWNVAPSVTCLSRKRGCD